MGRQGQPYDWAADPGCSWLRHPAGHRPPRPAPQGNLEFAAPWWWVALVVAVAATTAALMDWLA